MLKRDLKICSNFFGSHARKDKRVSEKQTVGRNKQCIQCSTFISIISCLVKIVHGIAEPDELKNPILDAHW